jgi:hypothetical protein
MLGMDPSPDPSRCARRVPCCQASAASTDMRSVGNSGSLGWIKTNCHMFWGMKINQHQLVWCQLTHNIKPHCPSKTISVFKQGLQSCFGSLHWFRILGTCGHCTCLYPPFETSVCLWLTLWKLHCQFLGGVVTARTLVDERTLHQWWDSCLKQLLIDVF